VRCLAPAAVAWIAAAASCTSAAAQSSTTPADGAVLAVPYLPQSEDLCGGAAAAMVMRYWGAADIYPEAFATLVDHSAGGIRTSALVGSLQSRGWTAAATAGNTKLLDDEIARRRPVIALIEVAPNRYHYVVVVARDGEHTVVHDPARAPNRSLTNREFDRAWAATDRWMLTLLPPAGLNKKASAPDAFAPEPPASCAPLVTRGIAAAQRDRAASTSLLEQAARACPDSSAPWRELAGVAALDKDWQLAADRASHAVALDPRDDYAWDVLATSRFLTGRDTAALKAWNHAGEPIVDLVNVTGLERTRYRIVYDTAGVVPDTLLTPSSLRLAERRVSDIPSIATAVVSYHPTEGRRAQVDVAVVEREAYPRGVPAAAALGIGAAVNRTIDGSVSSPTGGGERIDASWRWWTHRPAASVSFVAPAPWLGGTWQVDVGRETETFAPGLRQTRTRFGAAAGAWLTDRVRIAARAGIDRWADGARQAVFGGDAEFWPLADYVDVDAAVSHWMGSNGFTTGSVNATLRSSTQRSGSVWLARAGIAAASANAPALVWPGADTGHVRDVLLRAHPLLDDGVIAGGVFGRRLISSGIEYQRWTRPSKWLLQYAPAGFVDLARATRGIASTITDTQVDAGVGLRLSAPGAGVLRIDVAHGLRDGRNALSVVWQR
jgi:hypothetical protein